VLRAESSVSAAQTFSGGEPQPGVLAHDAQRRHFAALAYGSLRQKPALTNTDVAYFSTARLVFSTGSQPGKSVSIQSSICCDVEWNFHRRGGAKRSRRSHHLPQT
jgi:hypothetical protein